MTDSAEWLAERLRTEGKKTVDFFQGLTGSQWTLRVYTEGSQWTIRQVLAHFVATENAFDLLIRDILAGGPGAPPDFDIDRYNESRVRNMEGSELDELLAIFTSLRSSSVRLVEQMTSEDLQKRGRHPWLGETMMLDIIKLLYRHNQIHQRDIRKILSSGT